MIINNILKQLKHKNMTTAQKREHFFKKHPKQWKKIYELIDKMEFRQLDSLANEWNDPNILGYVITILCDELMISERTESVDEY